ncbi:MAG TPA: cation diffusion facilitator family transporter, partial [Candidatus Acidoferrales bacterium]|nr:cation diffusion facilitator family transporter [Candidatus Acidoferrales bacterium]
MAGPIPSQQDREKQSVALRSLLAAVALTTFKIVVGVATGSLGILAEAAHSGLDLVAALLTFIAVRISGRPADHDHLYGHGKVENLSALAETVLLLLTCAWIFWEAIQRLFSHKAEIEVTWWSFGVMLVSIAIDASRSRALARTAKKYHSQALEADALHFQTDIWSSTVVIFGLASVKVGQWFPQLSSLRNGDAVAALGVS